MSFFAKFTALGGGAVANVQAAMKDAYLDAARKDDAVLGAHLMLAAASGSGGVDPAEAKALVPVLGQIFKNFTPNDLNPIVNSAASTFSPMPTLGVAATADMFRDFNDDAGTLKLIARAAVGVAKMGGLDPEEWDALNEIFQARAGFDATSVGFPATRPAAAVAA